VALEDILKALEDKVSSSLEAVQEEAEQKASEIKAEAEKDASRTRRMKLKKVEEAIRSEATSIVYSASLKAKNEVIKAQEEVVEDVFANASKRLSEIRDGADYPKVMKVLISQCFEFIDGEAVLQVRQDDRAITEQVMGANGKPFRFADKPLEASGGVIASSADGSITVSNSLETRLERARSKLRLDVSDTLFKEPAAAS
jgi:vacuolar-type H+-ATPase subunit E/Vma4